MPARTATTDVYKRQLSAYAQVSVASSVHGALPLIASQQWNIICSDINMRDGTGIDIYSFMERHNCKADFILMTAHLQPEAMQQKAISKVIIWQKTSPDFLPAFRRLLMEANDFSPTLKRDDEAP